MEVIDIFSFNNELDILEIRLNVLDKAVDQFIICEADETFTGLPKPRYFQENKERFAKFLPKIKHYIMASGDPILMLGAEISPGVPQELPWWKREYTQKESMRYALTHLQDEDIIYIGDVDEIWNPLNMPPLGRWKLEQKVYSYYLNNRSNEWWEGTSVMSYGDVKDHTLDNLRAHDVARATLKAPTYHNDGWHFTNMGDTEFIKQKLQSYSHQEFNTPQFINSLETQRQKNEDFLGRGFKMWKDDTELPLYILENKEKYQHLWKV